LIAQAKHSQSQASLQGEHPNDSVSKATFVFGVGLGFCYLLIILFLNSSSR